MTPERAARFVVLAALAGAACGELTTSAPDATAPPDGGGGDGGGRLSDAAVDDGAPSDADAGPPPDPNVRYVFVSSASTDARFDAVDGGAAGADAICAAEAKQANLPGVYAAFVAGGQELTAGVKPWQLRTGILVFDGDAPPTVDSTSTVFPKKPITQHADGSPVAAGTIVWVGAFGNETCRGWQSKSLSDLGGTGNPFAQDIAWQSAAESKCDGLQSVYCFEL